MDVNLAALVKDRFGSKDKAGAYVREEWARREPGASMPEVRSLGAKVGELATKGQARWWRNHPVATEILCEALNLDVPDVLGFREPEEATEFGFPEFPALRPLGRGEPPCDIVRFVQRPVHRFAFGSQPAPTFRTLAEILSPRDRYGSPDWLVIPPGGGKRILSWVLRAHFEAAPPRGLVAALSLAPARPAQVRRVTLRSPTEIGSATMGKAEVLIVVIGGFSTTDDLAAIERLRERGNVVVLAPFEPGDGWNVGIWCPEAGWRRKLVSWAHARIDTSASETLLDPDLLADLLDRADPDEGVFATPGDVLSLCSYAHEAGRRELTKRFKAVAWAEAADKVCAEMMRRGCGGRDDVDAGWLRAQGARAARALTEVRFANVGTRLSGGLEPSAWADLLPEALAPGRPASDALLEDLVKLARVPDEKSRLAQARSLPRRAFGPAQAEAVELLGQVGLLQGTATGGVDIHPGWFRRAWQGEFVRAAFEGDPETWGRWTIDPERLVVVRTELAALDAVRYGELVERLASARRGSTGVVAAGEVLFREAVRRIEEDATWSPSGNLLHAAWRLQSQSLVPRDGLLTPLFGRDESGGWAEWIADCWTFSLRAPAPDEMPAGMPWLFPGWTEPNLDDVPAWLEALPSVWNCEGVEHVAARIDRLAPAVLGKAKPLVNGQRVPDALLLGVFRAGQSIGWALPFGLVEQLLENREAASYLGKHLAAAGETERREIVDRFWRALREGPRQPPQGWDNIVRAFAAQFEAVPYLSRVRSVDKQLHAVLVNTLSEEQVEAAFDSITPEKAKAIAGAEELVKANKHLPPRLRLAMIRKVLAMGLEPPVEAAIRRAASESLGESPDDAQLAELLAITPEPTGVIGSRREAMAAVWRLTPDRALHHARASWPGRDEALDWFLLAPPEWFDRLLDAAEATPSSDRPGWTREWLASRFPPAPQEVDRVFRLISEAQGWPLS